MLRAILTVLLMLISTSLFAGNVTVSWDANSESDLAGYKIYYGTASGNYDKVVNVGNTSSQKIENLTDGQTYYFVVTAFDASGNESDFSAEVNIVVQPPQDTEAPKAPANVKVIVTE